jgi:hypothetical protein
MTTPNGFKVGDRAILRPFPFEGMECPMCGRSPLTSLKARTPLWECGMKVEIVDIVPWTPACAFCGTDMLYDAILVGLVGSIPWTWLDKIREEV